MAAEPLLSRSVSYRVKDSNEGWWQFKYGENSGRVGWWVFFNEPGSVLLSSKGRWSEEKVFEFLTRFGHVLDDDDRIDLGVWLQTGGLEKMLAEDKAKREEVERRLVELTTNTENLKNESSNATADEAGG